MMQSGTVHWLQQLLQAAYPATTLPENTRVAESTVEAWRQLATLYQISAEDVAEVVAVESAAAGRHIFDSIRCLIFVGRKQSS